MRYLKIPLLIYSLFVFIGVKGQSTGDTSIIDSSDRAKQSEEAFFPGGNNAWAQFLSHRIQSDVAALNNAPAGRYKVQVRFTINADGSVSLVNAVTNFGYGMEEEVIRVIKKSPQWLPATINGKPARAFRLQTITFVADPLNFAIHSAKPYVLFTQTENEISIDAGKVKLEDVSVSISDGSIKPIQDAPGKYIIRVNKPGRVLIELFNTKKKNEEIGTASFEVVLKK